MIITNVSLLPLGQAYGGANIAPAVIPALRKLTVEVADDDVSGKSAVSIHARRLLILHRMGRYR
jgi:hypothetical protein